MGKPVFYCDCDGVILNTIEIAYQIMRECELDISNRKEVDYFFKKMVDWNMIFDRAIVIDNAINKLKSLKNEDIFKNIFILTKLSGGYDEERLKRDLFSNLLPEIKVITLQYGLTKGLVVKAKDNILVDDEIGNCKKWENEGGSAILFSPYMSNLETNIINDLIDVKNANCTKKLLKARNI